MLSPSSYHHRPERPKRQLVVSPTGSRHQLLPKQDDSVFLSPPSPIAPGRITPPCLFPISPSLSLPSSPLPAFPRTRANSSNVQHHGSLMRSRSGRANLMRGGGAGGLLEERRAAYHQHAFLSRQLSMMPLSRSFSGRFESLSSRLGDQYWPQPHGSGGTSMRKELDLAITVPAAAQVSSGARTSTSGVTAPQSPWQRFPVMLHNNLCPYLSNGGGSDNGGNGDGRRGVASGKNEVGAGMRPVCRSPSSSCAATLAGPANAFVRSISCDAALSTTWSNMMLFKVNGAEKIISCIPLPAQI